MFDLFFLFLNQNICLWGKKPLNETVLLSTQNTLFKLMDKKIITNLRKKICLITIYPLLKMLKIQPYFIHISIHELVSCKKEKLAYAPTEDSDQPGHLGSQSLMSDLWIAKGPMFLQAKKLRL